MEKKEQVKLLQFIGTRNKSDFVLYLAHMLTNLKKRVLVVDVTKNKLYQHGYTRLGKEQHLYDFQGIDILCGIENWFDIEECLLRQGETSIAYDLIIIDMDSVEIVEQAWPEFNERFYVGDFDRANQLNDVALVKSLVQSTEDNRLKRITFESKHNFEADFFDTLLDMDIEWRAMHYLFEPDEYIEELRIQMQHTHEIPYRQLSKQHKELLTEIVSMLFELHVDKVSEAVKAPFFRFPFKRTKPTELESSNV